MRLALKHREDIPSRILEPGDVGTHAYGLSTCYSFLVLVHVFIALEYYSLFNHFIYGVVDVFDCEIKHRKRCGFMIRFWIEKYAGSLELKIQSLFRLFYIKAKNLIVEFFGFL